VGGVVIGQILFFALLVAACVAVALLFADDIVKMWRNR